MELIFFDLDGTLLDANAKLSNFTKQTLSLLSERDLAYTVATGRSMLSANKVLQDHEFTMPQIFNNGVTLWHPSKQQLSFENLLRHSEIDLIVETALKETITPFINVVEQDQHSVFFSQPQHPIEKQLVDKFFAKTDAKLLPLNALSDEESVTNISMIGDAQYIDKIWHVINQHPHLIAYSGPSHEGENYRWMDIHHRDATKGSAILKLKAQLGVTNIICFGDSDNDHSMFEIADECYAPANAKQSIKEAATHVIGHHNEDGIAHFLRERFL